MSADLTALLDRLEAAAAAATPGPWQVDDDGDELAVTARSARGLPGSFRSTDRICRADVGEWSGEMETDSDQRRADAALIVAAVNAVGPLIAELRAHQAAVQAVRELADGLEWLVQDESVDEVARVAHAWTLHRIRAAVAALDPKEQDHA